jgi:DNA-binding response OmpR family regulator
MPEKILIVDDDVDTVRLVGLMLERQGYEVCAASTGEQALTMIPVEQPDLILLDIMMPGVDGYEVARQLRAAISTTHIPIIMFTAKDQLDDKLTGYEIGADDYITKPCQPRELLAHVKAVLSRNARPLPVSTAVGSNTTVAVFSAKGGLGVTTLAINLAIAIHQSTKQPVLVAEFRPGQGLLAMDLGYQKPDGYNRILSLPVPEISIKDIEREFVTHNSGVRILLSSNQPGDAVYQGAVRSFSALASCLSSLPGYVILDLSPSLTHINQMVLDYCDIIILVVEPTAANAIQTRALIQDLQAKGFSPDQLKIALVNRISSSIQLSWTQVQEQIGFPISTVFSPVPDLAYLSSTNQVPMVLQQPESLVADQFHKLADKIVQGVLERPNG